MRFWTLRLVAAGACCVALVACSNSHEKPNGGSAPSLTSATPAQISARGGEIVTLRGHGLSGVEQVRFGDTGGEIMQRVSDAEIQVKTPPLFAGQVFVEVSSGAGSARLASSVAVMALDLRFLQAPNYSLALEANDTPDAGADGGTDAGSADLDVGTAGAVGSAVARDFDGDGDTDLVACASGWHCHLLDNDGRGNFEDRSTEQIGLFSGTRDTRRLAAGDFDGDGDEDLFVVTNAGAFVEVNDGIGGFTESPVMLGGDGDAGSEDAGATAGMPNIGCVAVTDLDLDGKQELVLGTTDGTGSPLIIATWSSWGAGSFVPSSGPLLQDFDWKVRAIAIGDLDGDKRPDVLIATPGAADDISLRLLLNKADGLVPAPGGLLGKGYDISALAVGDFNGDGSLDVLAAGQGQDRLLLNDGSAHFFDSTLTSLPLDVTEATSAIAIDLDRDRDLDLVIGNRKAPTRIYLNQGDASFRDKTPLLPVAATDARWVGVPDVDGDGDQDVLLFNEDPAIPRLYLSVEREK